MATTSIINNAYLLTGGNMGDRKSTLAKALAQIEAYCGPVIKASSLYETAAWGKNDQPLFLNQALQIETTFNARQLLRHVLAIEKNIGRVREERYGPRIIDIDILLFNQEIHNYPLLKLPHPELVNRRFALTPLAEIAPALLHPVYNKTIAALLADCTDELEVKIVDGK